MGEANYIQGIFLDSIFFNEDNGFSIGTVLVTEYQCNEEQLKRLEELSASIKKSDISLEDALKDFEEGIKLAKSMEKSLDEMESKIQILMNNPEVSEEDEKSAQGKKQKSKSENAPVLGLFDESSEITGTRA